MANTSVQFSVAIHLMAALGLYDGVPVTSATLAESVCANPSFVRKVLAKLSRAGLVAATDGKGGACMLARAPEAITLLDIYLASEAPQTFSIHTYPVWEECPVSQGIKGSMASVLSQGQAGFESSLAKQTLAELVAEVKRSA